jgi:hypothetical protein
VRDRFRTSGASSSLQKQKRVLVVRSEIAREVSIVPRLNAVRAPASSHWIQFTEVCHSRTC